MQVYREINQLPSFKNAVITIGTFDGVHTGHLQIIKLLKQESAEVKGESVIITFHPHPRMVLGAAQRGNKPTTPVSLLNTLSEKVRLIEQQDIGHLVIAPFTHEFSLLTADEYIKDFLIDKFHPHTIIIGYDHHFGKRRQGNYKLLEAYAGPLNYVVKEIPEHVINQVAISSTRIREALLNADIETANKFLGYEYFFEGTVIEGDKLGRNLGYPTANIKVTDGHKLIPADGVYAVELQVATLKPALLKGMMNIGYRPTIGGTKKMIEVNIFDFNKEIYGEQIRIFVKKYLRTEQKFNGLEFLKIQLSMDKANAIKILNQHL
ncbi:MAG: bifunctional riboflavin kinase/FAD synthetase [Ginsengibacter sp.]